MIQIVIPVDKKAVTALRIQLTDLLRTANDISKDCTYTRLKKAKETLCEAKGMYQVLKGLDLLEATSLASEDIDRIEAKIQGICEEKRREEIAKMRKEKAHQDPPVKSEHTSKITNTMLNDIRGFVNDRN